MTSEQRDCPGPGALVALSLTPLLAGLALMAIAASMQRAGIGLPSVLVSFLAASAVVISSPFVALMVCRSRRQRPTRGGMAAWCITLFAGAFVLLAVLTVW
jgi:hypothetical protein